MYNYVYVCNHKFVSGCIYCVHIDVCVQKCGLTQIPIFLRLRTWLFQPCLGIWVKLKILVVPNHLLTLDRWLGVGTFGHSCLIMAIMV